MKRSIIIRKLFLALFILQACSFVSAQTIARQPKNAKVDYTRLSRIDSLVNAYISNNWLTGAVTIVIKDNQLVHYKGYGYADVASKKPMTSDAIFRIMSQTKAITSAAIMILYDQGKLLLDQPVSDFIPEFKNMTVLDKFNDKDSSFTTVPAKTAITIRQLLTHTSGLDYPDIGSSKVMAIYAKNRIPSGLGYFNENLLDKMKVLAKLPLSFQPGEKWQYGLNSDLLGCLIEVISGMSLEDFFSAYIFKPAGMNDTYFNVPPSKHKRLATVYTEDEKKNIIPWSHSFRNIDPDYPMMKMKYYSGGAGLSSTAFDYAIFMQMLLNGGVYNGKRILSRRSVELMTTSQLAPGMFWGGQMGLGFGITSEESAAKGPRYAGSFSWGGYYGTTYWADPKAGLVCLFLTQQTPNSHGDVEQKFESLVYASLED